MNDYMGNEIHIGDTVLAGAYGYGIPKFVTAGVVVGFNRVRVRVRWNCVAYLAEDGHDTARPEMLRVFNSTN